MIRGSFYSWSALSHRCFYAILINMKKFLSTIWQAVYPLLIEYAVTVMVTAGVGAFFALYIFLRTGEPDLNRVLDIITEQSILITGFVSVVMIPVLLVLMKDDSERFGTEKNGKCRVTTIFVCMIGACGAALAGNLIMNLTGFIEADDTFDQYIEIFENTAPLVLTMVTVVLAPVCEELMYRGVIFRRIRSAYGFVPAAILSSVLFGAGHGNLTQGLYSFALGLLFSYAYHRTGKIRVTILMHMAANAFATIADAVLTDTPPVFAFFGNFFGLTGIAGGVVLTAACVIYLKETERL